MNRRVTIQTPLGDQLQLRKLTGEEAMNQLFELDVELLSTSPGIDPKALLGKNATAVVETAGGGQRHLDGIVTRFGMAGQDHKHYAYRAKLRPWLWLATRQRDFRIFQFKTVPDILTEVLGRYGYPLEQRLTRSYRAWDYCVQYDESDYDFAARLMEHEGICYHFEHSAGQHQLVMGDDVMAAHKPLPGAASIPFHPPDKAVGADEECIYAWSLAQELPSGRHFNDDYDFKKPRADLSNMRQNPPGHAHDAHEVYEWPGGYTEHGDGETYARVRLEEHLATHSRMQGTANHRALACGHHFALTNYPRADQNQNYLLVGLRYHFEENAQVSAVVGALGAVGDALAAGTAAAEGTRTESGSVQRIELQAHPTSIPYRPARVTPKPRTRGPQTAVVVGPAGEEIWCDQYGRVKVQFHWDRLGAMDENSSCWVRVSTSWAGGQFGNVYTPRIGMEVIIDFLSGDPDYPILTGCVYNADNMPPWKLPDNKTQSGTQTRWSKGGGGASMLRFEDKKGVEHLELSNTYGNTYLNMGYLMHQGDGLQRGYGFELRTNLWGSIRADKGLLITTYTQDHTAKTANDNPDGFDDLGATLASTSALMQNAGQAVSSMDATIGALGEAASSQLTQMGAGIAAMTGGSAGGTASLGRIASAVTASAQGGGAGPGAAMPSDTDPAMGQARELMNLSKDISQPVVSIVSPQGQSIISPKAVVVSSGQSVSLHAQQHITVSSGAQLTQLAKSGMLTHVTSGGQRNVVSAGDVASVAETGHMNLVAQQNITLSSTTLNANVLAKENVVVNADSDTVFVRAGKHITGVAGESITLACGRASITLKNDGTIVLNGVKGIFNFTENLDQFGQKINLNC